MLFLLADSPQKLKLEKVHGALIAFFYASPISTPLQSPFKENAKILSKKQVLSKIIKKTTALQQVIFGRIPNLVLKRTLELFLKIPPLKKILEFQDRKNTGKLMQKRKLQIRN